MFRESSDYKKFGVTTVNCLLADNGLGDQLCSLMAIDYIAKNCPWINLLVWVPDYMKSFCRHVVSDKACIRNYTEATTKYDNNKPGISTKNIAQHTPMRIHPAKFAFHALCDMEGSLTDLSYLKINPKKINISHFDLPENIVILQGAYTEIVKTMPVETFNKLTDYIIEKGYIPVYLGRTENDTGIEGISNSAKIDENYDLSKGINLLNKTSLLESAAIIDKSQLFIGMDGGLTHLAGFTNTNIVTGYTFASHEHLMPVRDGIFGKNVYPIIPDESLNCKFCQSNLTLLYDHDFRNCIYDDYKCVKQITFDKFKQKIEDNNLI